MLQSSVPKMRYHKRKYHSDDEYRRKHIASSCASQKRRRATPDGFILNEIRRIRHRCKERGLSFNLTPQDLEVPLVCPALGIPITLGASPRAPGSPSIDRIIPALGYVRGNVRVISWRANHLKNNCTDPGELRKIAGYMESACPT